jgi:hypothetical protein
MGVFDKPTGGEPALVLPSLSRERVEESLGRHEWHYLVDEDGDVIGSWEHNTFYFFVTGKDHEILQIQGRWHQRLPMDMRNEALMAINQWHVSKLWPKGYVHVDDSGRLWVHAEHVVDWEHGVTDEQLDLTIVCALTTSLKMFEYVADQFSLSFTPREP